MKLPVLVVDNRDSFVFNLAEDLARLGCACAVVRSDVEPDELLELTDRLDPALVVLSPGPGRPEEHRALLPFLASRPDRALLGVCLGMQAMASSLGGVVSRSPDGPMHGRAGRVVHDGDPLFDGLPSGFLAGRYHSLCVSELPDELAPIAWSDDRRTLLALRHRERPWVGLQFHPESVLTPDGRALLSNVLRTLS